MTACTTTTSVGLKYSAPATVTKANTPPAPIAVGTFVDQRGEPATWIGAIRGGYGNPLKHLETNQPVSVLVQMAFADGLRARGVNPETAAPMQIAGVVRKLDCNQLMRSEANVEIEVSIIDTVSGQQRFSRTYKTTNSGGMSLASGIFGSIEDLRALTEKTLREAVDSALDDTALRAALRL
jgi:hypothetical protein